MSDDPNLRAYDYLLNGVPHTIGLPPGAPPLSVLWSDAHMRSVARAQCAIEANRAAGAAGPTQYVLIDDASGAVGHGVLHENDDAQSAAKLSGWFGAMGLRLGWVLLPGAAEYVRREAERPDG